MTLNYKTAVRYSKPETVEITKNTVFIRKDIEKQNIVSEEGIVTSLWIYKEAKLSHDDFVKYSSLIASKNAVEGINDTNNILQLMSDQENGDNNQLIIMEAIADLYDAISNITQGGSST